MHLFCVLVWNPPDRNAILLVLSIWTRREMGVKYCEFTTRVRQINGFIQTSICFSLDLRILRTLNGYLIVMRRRIASNFKPSPWGSTVSNKLVTFYWPSSNRSLASWQKLNERGLFSDTRVFVPLTLISLESFLWDIGKQCNRLLRFWQCILACVTGV